MYLWDGQRWVSALSPDGKNRWDGSAWVPVTASDYPRVANMPRPKTRETTSWTKPLQYAVAGWFVLFGIYSALLPLAMRDYISAVAQQSVQRQRRTYPPGEAPPPGFTDLMNTVMSATLWSEAIFFVAIAVVAIVGAWKRWTWSYYAVLVVLGIGLIGLVFNLIDVVLGGSITAAQTIRPPAWSEAVAYARGPIDAALFVWMLVALIRRGPWGMRRIS
jgi:hypothetical protein